MQTYRQPPAKIAVLAILSLGILFCIAACQQATKRDRLRQLEDKARTALTVLVDGEVTTERSG